MDRLTRPTHQRGDLGSECGGRPDGLKWTASSALNNEPDLALPGLMLQFCPRYRRAVRIAQVGSSQKCDNAPLLIRVGHVDAEMSSTLHGVIV